MAPSPAPQDGGDNNNDGGATQPFSPPGSATYASNTMHVGDGTWDFTKNTFLLPNLMGLNFDTMRYNGMGNRFSTLTQYHSLIIGHGVVAAIVFLFLVPAAVFLARYYTHRPGTAIRYHIYLNILTVGLSTVVFILGFIAVGPPRNLTNPHHGIGVAIYVMILVQAVGGRIIKTISKRGRSFRRHLHRWGGRIIAVLGVVQIPLGLTLYGSPKVLFILYAVWMGILVFMFFILDFRDHGRGDWLEDGGTVTEVIREKKEGGKMKWLGPLAAGAGAIALMRGRSNKSKGRDTERGSSRSRSRSRSRSPGTEYTRTDFTRSEYTRGPATTVMTDSYYDEKPSRRRASTGITEKEKSGGFFSKLLGVGAGIGAGALAGRMMKRGNSGRRDDYSAVSTETPSRVRGRGARSDFTESEYTEITEDMRRKPSGRARSPILPAPNPVAAAAAMSAAESRRPTTPPRRHGTSRLASTIGNEPSDYSSYVSPSRRASERRKSSSAAPAKGFLSGIGLGWLASRMGGGGNKEDQREQQRLRDEEERRRDEEEDRRYDRRRSKYDDYQSPGRDRSRRRLHRPPPPQSTVTATTMTATSVLSDESSIEPRGPTPYDPAPPGIRPVPAGAPPAPGPPPFPGSHSGPPPVAIPPGGYSADRVSMPPMPPDPRGFLRQESSSDGVSSPGRRRRRDGDAAAAAAVATASALAAQEEEDRRRRGTPAASVQLRIDPERSNNYTLRRLTEEEIREQERRRRDDSVSSDSETDTPTTATRRYRRERSDRGRDSSSSQRRAERAAEQRAEYGGAGPSEPLAPPSPAFAGGARRPGPPPPAPGLASDPTVSTLADNTTVTGVPTAGGVANTASPMASHTTLESAADRRRARRRLERRDGSRQPPSSVDYA